METEPVDIGTFIVRESGFRQGRPFIAGTRRSVQSIAAMYKHGRAPEDIARSLPFIPREKLYAALTYYFANQCEIDADLLADAELYDRLADEDREHRRAAAGT